MPKNTIVAISVLIFPVFLTDFRYMSHSDEFCKGRTFAVKKMERGEVNNRAKICEEALFLANG
jgi:hypothetical protein